MPSERDTCILALSRCICIYPSSVPDHRLAQWLPPRLPIEKRLGFGVCGLGCVVRGLGFWVWGLWFEVWGLGLGFGVRVRVWGFGFGFRVRVWGLGFGFGIWGLGLGLWGAGFGV